MRAANDIAEKGFKDVGYEYVVLDDCWSIKTGRNNITNRIMPNMTKFPDGIDGWVSKLTRRRVFGVVSSIETLSALISLTKAYPNLLFRF